MDSIACPVHMEGKHAMPIVASTPPLGASQSVRTAAGLHATTPAIAAAVWPLLGSLPTSKQKQDIVSPICRCPCQSHAGCRGRRMPCAGVRGSGHSRMFSFYLFARCLGFRRSSFEFRVRVSAACCLFFALLCSLQNRRPRLLLAVCCCEFPVLPLPSTFGYNWRRRSPISQSCRRAAAAVGHCLCLFRRVLLSAPVFQDISNNQRHYFRAKWPIQLESNTAACTQIGCGMSSRKGSSHRAIEKTLRPGIGVVCRCFI